MITLVCCLLCDVSLVGCSNNVITPYYFKKMEWLDVKGYEKK